MADQEISHVSLLSGEKEEEMEAVKGRGIFDFMKEKNEDQDQEYYGGVPDEVPVAGVDEIDIGEEKKKKDDDQFYEEEEEKKTDDSSSSSSSDEEEYEEVDGEKKKKKKGLKEKIKEKLRRRKKDDGGADQEVSSAALAAAPADGEDTNVVIVEKIEGSYEVEESPTAAPEENKGFLEKIKEKLPGHHHKKAGEETICPPPSVAKETISTPPPAAEENTYPPSAVTEVTAYAPPVEGPPEEEKKEFSERINEKLPGSGQDQEKPSEEAASPPPAAAAAAEYISKDQKVEGDHAKDQKKGIFSKIMEKLPGYNYMSSGGGEDQIIKESENKEIKAEKDDSN